MTQVISVVNHKGGVGKTTTAVNVAAVLGEAGQQVLLVDMDPQGSASMFLGMDDEGLSLLQALQHAARLPVVRGVATGVDLVPAGPRLIDAAQRFTVSLGTELLARCLPRTEGSWKWVIVDCPPSMGVLTIAALRAGSRALIPVEASYLAMRGLGQLMAFLDSLRHHVAEVEIAGVVPCRAHPRRRVHGEVLADLERQFPGRVAPCVRENVSLAEAPGLRHPVITSAPRSHGAEDYRQVARWLMARLA
jgi:chromosome partitioning protein